MKLQIKPTERGFLRVDFQDDLQYNCSIQESGLKDEKCLWLGINEGIHAENGKPINHQEFTELGMNCLSRMHLTQEMAGELAKQLAYFARTGKLLDSSKVLSKQDFIVIYDKKVNNKWVKFYLGIIKETKRAIALNFAVEKYKLVAQDNFRWYLHVININSKEFSVYKNKENILKWLSEGQQGFYTPNGLVKEL